MTCKRLSRKARAEQDYWLSFSDFKDVTEEERLDFLRYDSHGGEKPRERRPRLHLPFGELLRGKNPILLGKSRHGQLGNVKGGKRGGMMIDSYFDIKGGWPGGLYLVADYLTREPFNVRPLREWFGDEAVHRWLTAFIWEAFRV
ncbi:hypothetical protein LCGC14_1885550 [marine sediment metagenome]|uniref:Uncharacterized protein n=1 Tax=marine sediment metagenome TaxID=412755 RepID=A0A0F9G138_9ZZZZ